MPKLTPVQYKQLEKKKQEAIDLYKQGTPYRQIAEAVGYSLSWVHLTIKEHQGGRKPKKSTKLATQIQNDLLL